MNQLSSKDLQQGLLCGQVFVFQEIDSTNEYLLNHCHALPCGSICLAEMQTAGRGRRGRQWYSPKGKNLYLSMLWKYDQTTISYISALSLVVAIIIAETFQQLNVPDIQIKWPNDIYYQGKKMGGILLETKSDKSNIYLVIGIGLNLSLPTVNTEIVTQAWTDLSDYEIDRNLLASILAKQLQKALSEFPSQGFIPYLTSWQKFDYFYQSPVTLFTDNQEIDGIAQGVNEVGQLLLKRKNALDAFSIGEISLRQHEDNYIVAEDGAWICNLPCTTKIRCK
ncbi:BirA family biotin operon repressor/biotin-[acetyl-CoA-carboxylase] ligase [Nicoletella semolina]|uniref:biotin--[biotin carboxyl-carrier protein] ligase n=1 Tax=Nicoletella semolina TaxID=271160 RepID=A0A4R2N8W0_9PAST|nr:biotin--[acetyl-CoA-carboxylase] ligase [Nicoletella semolina]TCP17409.1 BirA family biotin operon repressor/biotin-[acetyl-CoA-carboxylase] ligase [Nicoletella semolina]